MMWENKFWNKIRSAISMLQHDRYCVVNYLNAKQMMAPDNFYQENQETMKQIIFEYLNRQATIEFWATTVFNFVRKCNFFYFNCIHIRATQLIYIPNIYRN